VQRRVVRATTIEQRPGRGRDQRHDQNAKDLRPVKGLVSAAAAGIHQRQLGAEQMGRDPEDDLSKRPQGPRVGDVDFGNRYDSLKKTAKAIETEVDKTESECKPFARIPNFCYVLNRSLLGCGGNVHQSPKSGEHSTGSRLRWPTDSLSRSSQAHAPPLSI
jgi:hypothetical protein